MSAAVRDASSLAEFIRNRRWFRSKTRNIEKAEVVDIIDGPGSAQILIVKLDYAEGDCDHYVLTDTNNNSGQPVEALDDPDFRGELLNAFLTSAMQRGQNGELVFSRTNALRGSVDGRKLPSSVSRAEQSNPSIIFGDQFILKLFRKIEPGTNPDVEIGAFLTERGFANTPAVLGTLEYRTRSNHVYSAGILQEFVPNQGDAWKYTLDSLKGYFDRAAQPGASDPATSDPQQLVGEYLKSAALLGQRTAEMHIALSTAKGNPDFEPQPFTPEAGRKLHDEMLAQADIAFETLRRKRAALSGEAAEAAQKLLHLENRVTERFTALRHRNLTASRIRIHGDYHLGQVLWNGSDFKIIDFEGEPARPLQERRAMSLAMRDVAGMLRSFQYAAYAALFNRGDNGTLDRWADACDGWVSAAFLSSYLQTAQSNVFMPEGEAEQRLLRDAFLLHKALYEVAYELNNRPDWVRIPLKGILSLVA